MFDADNEAGSKARENAPAEEDRNREATTGKTLSDIEKNEATADAGKSKEDQVPSPDTQTSEQRREPDDAGPM